MPFIDLTFDNFKTVPEILIFKKMFWGSFVFFFSIDSLSQLHPTPSDPWSMSRPQCGFVMFCVLTPPPPPTCLELVPLSGNKYLDAPYFIISVCLMPDSLTCQCVNEMTKFNH